MFRKRGDGYVIDTSYRFPYENPFNVEAEWICHLRGLSRELFYQPDLRKTSQPLQDPEEEVSRFFHSLPHISDGKLLLRSGVPPEEKEAVRTWAYSGSFFHMLCFLSLYTEQMTCQRILDSAWFASLTHTDTGADREFESLNTNVEETGLLILPKVKTINDPLDPAGEEEEENAGEKGTEDAAPGAAPPEKRWAADRVPGIQDQLSHTFYIETEELALKDGRRYRVANSVLRRHMFPEDKKSLLIAVCPLAHADLLDVKTYCRETENGRRRLCSAGLKCGKFVQDKVRADLLRAGKEHADIAVFPEMLGSAEMLAPVFFREIREELKAGKCPVPSLILMPTCWHENRNELHVLDAVGKRLCTQQKQTSYLFEGEDGREYAEDLREPERVVHIVHIPDLGRFVFPICKDYLDEAYVQMMLRYLRATFLLCPSYSPKKTQFDLTAHGGIQYGGYTIWCNTCAAYWKSGQIPGHIGLAAGPQPPGRPVCLLEPECGGKCGNREEPCVFLVKIAINSSADITCRHIYK